MLSINYRLPPVVSMDDQYVVGIENYLKRLMDELHVSGTRLVEFFPWMVHIPSR